ncbi:hypothetical protein QUA00_05635 [Microcoleus sp. T2B6]|uniref:hypothetical protein n=1 Tax=Microcoleus sp. T2B6 TaxID=3055424 RepID=UPI002FD4907E
MSNYDQGMEKLPDLKQLSNEAKEALIVELWEKIQKLTAALATTDQPKLDPSPKKTSKNSSTPPSTGFKPNIKPSKIEGIKRQRSLGRAGGEENYILIPTKQSSPN